MSLTSRLSGPFSTSDKTHATVSEVGGEPVSYHDGFSNPGGSMAITRESQASAAVEQSTVVGEDIEMKRPPYLHVSTAELPVHRLQY